MNCRFGLVRDGPECALLILDNCEHLISASAEFCLRALQRCPNLTIVATSREPLGVEGEMRWPVKPLSEADALSLFDERARLVRPDFRLTQSNRGDIVEICRRLDDLPLAIELAASTLGTMSARQISSQLASRRDLLTSSRSDDPRHRTMEATIDWSYRLLTESEAALFTRLAVFRGGFTVEGAGAVCGDPLVPDVLAALTGLVAKSMVVAEQLDDGEARYRLLESQQIYASDKLQANGESAGIFGRHYNYHWRAVRSRTAGLSGPMSEVVVGVPDAQWKRRESANIWAAIQWARDNRRDKGLPLASHAAMNSAIPDFELPHVRRWLADLIAQAPPDTPERITAFAAACSLAEQAGDYGAQGRYAQSAIDLMGPDVDTKSIETKAMLLYHLAGSKEGQRQLEAAGETYSKALDLLGGLGNARINSALHHGLAIVALQRGQFQQAREAMLAWLPTIESGHPPQHVAGGLESLANMDLACGDLESADRNWKRSLSIARELFYSILQIACIGGLARLATASGDHPRALRLAAAHDHLAELWAAKDPPWWVDQLRSAVERSSSELKKVKAEAAWREGLAMDLDRAVDYALEPNVQGPRGGPGLLSRRELEIVGLLATGMTNPQIGRRLFISERTVEGHLDRVRNKLNVGTRTEVATWAVANGLATVSGS